MTVLVFVHAHPDDEASQTAAAIARASDEGHRVVVVYATNGDHGEAPSDLAPGETTVARRREEAMASARVLGTARVAWLGYADSGMTGWEQNSAEGAFASADLDQAAARLVEVLDEEGAQVLVGYDWHGGYGHPDHVRVHALVHRAAQLARHRPRVLEATMNRDLAREMFRASLAAGAAAEDGWDPDAPADDGNPIGTPEAEIHWQVDATAYLDRRREALTAHASQTSDAGMMLAMPSEVFSMMFGAEHYLERDRPMGMVRGWFLDET